ncbi:hypothetical protein QR680_003759 [Steinernema hermaphroditum]|uniref:Peptidase M13 N-terminal domain-containing protein n=1 Tax=Steinernema hermaphroditum TaxID=289476 RepID=A0AA39HMU2_9BILA|nr:hypothetical protein QR680_003759 [Steinernema hermaphroditum]
MSGLVALLLLLPLCSAFDPSQLLFLNHSLSSTVHPCDDFHEFLCNTREYGGLSPALVTSLQPFAASVEDVLLGDNDTVVDVILPLLLLEAKKNETLREIGRRRAFEAMKNERQDPVMHYDPYSRHIVVIFVDYAVATTDYASLHPLLQGFVDGFFEKPTQISKCVLEYVTGSSIEEQWYVGQVLGFSTPAYHMDRNVPLVYYEGRNISIYLDVERTRKQIREVNALPSWIAEFTVSLEESHPLVQGAVEAFVEFHSELNITLRDMHHIVNILGTEDVKDLEHTVTAGLKEKKLFEKKKLTLLHDMATTGSAGGQLMRPFIKYMQLPVAKYIIEKNLNPKPIDKQLRKIFDDVKGVFVSVFEEKTEWSPTEEEKRAIKRVSSMQLAPELPAKFDLELINGLIQKIGNDFAAKKAESPLPADCYFACITKHYMHLLERSYDSHVADFAELLPYINLNTNTCGIAILDVYRDTLVPRRPGINLPEAFLYGHYGPSFVTFLMNSLAKAAMGEEGARLCSVLPVLAKLAHVKGAEIEAYVRAYAMVTALEAFRTRNQRIRGETGHGEAEMLFYGAYAGKCFAKPDPLDEKIRSIVRQLRGIFECKPGQKMFGRSV